MNTTFSQFKRITAILALVAMVSPWLIPAAFGAPDGPEATKSRRAACTKSTYRLDYDAVFRPADGVVDMQLTVRQPCAVLRELGFTIDPSRYSDFSGDGEVEVKDRRVSWRPPATGGSLHYRVALNHQRKSGSFDSLMSADWAIFRGDDLLPPARVRALKGTRSKARLRMSGPENWSFISAYPKSGLDSEWFEVDRADRKFDRPVGWMAAGELGVNWGDVAGVRVAIAGPTGQGIRRLDMFAFLRWNLPVLTEIFPEFPRRILLVSAGDPMWRGGLSGPDSLYIHADRPLISANGTSTLLHELIHLAQGYSAAKNQDWIVEAIAEFYTLDIMRRSGTISNRRHERGMGKLENWSNQATGLEAESSNGARTAKGVAIMQSLDDELREASENQYGLDDVVRQLSEDDQAVSIDRLREISAGLAGRELISISPKKLATY